MSSFYPKRRLRLETLEQRTVFSTTGMLHHNFVFPEDCNNDGYVTPLDALSLINSINRGGAASSDAVDQPMLDVNADGELSPIDPLVVINHLNRPIPVDTPDVSAVPHQDRITRLENAITNLTLPPSVSIDDARELLSTLIAGGRPEQGERFIDGRMRPPLEVQRIENERSAMNTTLPIADQDPAERARELVERFTMRLTAAGVDAQIIETIIGEIRQGVETNQPLTFVQIKSRLTELGVDVNALFPTVHDQPHPPHSNPEIDRRLTQWIDRLRAAGVNADIVNTVVGEIRASVAAGTPLTLNQIKARLTELGVDITQIFPPRNDAPPTHPTIPTPRIELVTSILRRAQVSPTTIEIVRNAMSRANSIGRPLNATQILDVLRDRGVRLPDIFARLLGSAVA